MSGSLGSGRAAARAPDRVFAAAFALLASTGVVALLHRLLGGLVLAHRGAALVVFVLSLAAVLRTARGAWRRSGPRPDPLGLAVAVGGVLLVLATWWGDPGGLPGDYTQHRMYTYQLLNGFAAPHVPYAGVPSHYTFLQSTAIALWMQLSGLSFHYAALAFACCVSVGVARLSQDVAARFGLGRAGSCFFAGLVVVYGGFWLVGQDDFFLYLPAVQLSMPFVSRNLALLLVLMSIWLAQAVAREDVGERDGALGIGVLVGLLGLTRPWEFGACGLVLLAWAVRSRSRIWGGAVAIAGVLAAWYFVPLLLAWWQLGIHALREVARPVYLPTSPFLYLPLGVFVLLSLLRWRGAPRAVLGCWLALAVIGVGAGAAALAGVLGGGGVLGIEGGLGKLDRVGQLLALPLFGIAAHGLETLRGRLAAAVAAAFLLVGFVSAVRVTTTWLDGEPSLGSVRWLQPPSWVFGMEGSRLYLRHLLDDPRTVVMAPVPLGELIARANGVDVVYSRTAVPIWRERPAGSISQGRRRQLVETFYAELGRGRIAGDLLREAGAHWFVAAGEIRSQGIEDVASLGKLGGVSWRLYRVAAADPAS